MKPPLLVRRQVGPGGSDSGRGRKVPLHLPVQPEYRSPNTPSPARRPREAVGRPRGPSPPRGGVRRGGLPGRTASLPRGGDAALELCGRGTRTSPAPGGSGGRLHPSAGGWPALPSQILRSGPQSALCRFPGTFPDSRHFRCE